jgi:hypothetical protein
MGQKKDFRGGVPEIRFPSFTAVRNDIGYDSFLIL